MSTITITNNTPHHYRGWKRTTCEPLSVGALEWADGTKLVGGRLIGIGCQAVDVFVEISPGETFTIDTSTGTPMDFQIQPLPPNPIEFFGGVSLIGGAVAQVLPSLKQDGAAWVVPLRARFGKMLCADVWLLWYPEQAWAFGEVLLNASNPSVTDMGEVVSNATLAIGDALIHFQGYGWFSAVPANEFLADGQGKAKPFVAVWPRMIKSPWDFSSAASAVSWGPNAIGLEKLLPFGGPLMPDGFDSLAWGRARVSNAFRVLHTWEPPVAGPPGISGSAGEQEDTLLHAGGEAVVAEAAGVEVVRYLSAMKLFAERPCNHREADGSWLEPNNHPSLKFWDGRPHWHTGVSPDRLGKLRNLTAEEAHGRWGPDVQHFYCRTLAAAARLTGSYACQQLLRNLATVYLLQRTSNPSWSTSQWESAREWGCEGLFVVTCHHDLEDRDMAARVLARWRERVERVLLPRMVGKDLLVVWQNDPRVNPTGEGVQWWQESFASWGIDVACELAGIPEGRQLALRIAQRVLSTAWTWVEGSWGLGEGDSPARFADEELQAIHEAAEPALSQGQEDAPEGRWRAQPQGPIDGSANEQNPATDSFNHYGMPLCAAVVLRQGFLDTKARGIIDQLKAAGGERSLRWVPADV